MLLCFFIIAVFFYKIVSGSRPIVILYIVMTLPKQ